MRERKLIHSQLGLSIIEQMIAMTIGLLVIGTVVATFITGSRGNTDVQRMARLDNELRAVVNLVAKDLRRAGYNSANKLFYIISDKCTLKWPVGGGTTAGDSVALTTDTTGCNFTVGGSLAGNKLRYADASANSPYYATITAATATSLTVTLDENFTSTPAELSKGTWAIVSGFTEITEASQVTGSDPPIYRCILVSYDSGGTNNSFGFRYDSGEKAVEARKHSSGVCGDPFPAATKWENISDESVVEIIDPDHPDDPANYPGFKITRVSVPVDDAGIDNHTQVEVKEYRIQITGRLKKDTTGDILTRSVEETVRVRNEALIE